MIVGTFDHMLSKQKGPQEGIKAALISALFFLFHSSFLDSHLTFTLLFCGDSPGKGV